VTRRRGIRTVAPTTVALRQFLATEAGGATLLLGAAVLALVWANSPWADSYETLWHTPAAITVGNFAVELDLQHWINDAAMSLFFLVVGLEISRELTTGEFTDRRLVVVPALGALGGVLVPALIYLAFNPSGETARGWGIAMSSDTAFVIGVLALFGPRCPDRLRLFLLALAIVDDVAAIGVMAVFYTDHVSVPALIVVAGILVGLLGLRQVGIRRPVWYVVPGVALWLAVYESGIHPTLAGVLLGVIIPTRPAPRCTPGSMTEQIRALLEHPTAGGARKAVLAAQSAVSPNERIQHALHPWTSYVVVPIFGLANAGVSLGAEALRAAAESSVTWGLIVALVVGNTIGITVGATIALRTGLGDLPGRVRYGHLLGGAALCGIGFTIALFITGLAFDSEVLRSRAIIGILVGSLVAAIAGSVLLRFFGERSPLCSPETEEAATLSLPSLPWREPVAGEA
jgi:Na+:H+ antiporter, NhaA family